MRLDLFYRIAYKYKNTPIEVKAAVWYAVGNIVQKISPWLILIILTHFLSTNDYGIYTIFMSWLEIFEIIITLRIYSNGYVAGLVRNDENKYVYTATIQSLCIGLVVIWLVIYLMFYKLVNLATGMDTKLTLLMICSFLGNSGYGLWFSRQRVNNQYIKMLIAIIFYGFLSSFIGAVTVLFDFDDPIFCIILIRNVIQSLIAILFLQSNYKKASSKWNRSFAVESLKYNIPLVPYYLSMLILSHSDRLMIQKIDGYADAALYGVAYSVSMLVFVISGALNLSLQAWLFKELKKNNNTNNSRPITAGTIIVVFFSLVEMIVAPEMILILGGEKYFDAIWVMPPLILNVIIIYIYQQYVNFLFYYRKTKLILGVSAFSAVCNIVLNAMFIPIFGYIVGGYTSLITYILVMILYYIVVSKECDKEKIIMANFFNTRYQFGILIVSGCFAIIIMLFYEFVLIRYLIIFVLIIVMILSRKKWMSVLKRSNK